MPFRRQAQHMQISIKVTGASARRMSSYALRRASGIAIYTYKMKGRGIKWKNYHYMTSSAKTHIPEEV